MLIVLGLVFILPIDEQLEYIVGVHPMVFITLLKFIVLVVVGVHVLLLVVSVHHVVTSFHHIH
jgi:hypothetical protein